MEYEIALQRKSKIYILIRVTLRITKDLRKNCENFVVLNIIYITSILQSGKVQLFGHTDKLHFFFNYNSIILLCNVPI